MLKKTKPEKLSEAELLKSRLYADQMVMGACFIVPSLYWLGIVNTGPVEWLDALGVINVPDAHALRSVFQWHEYIPIFLFYVVGGLAWSPISATVLLPFRRSLIAFFMGSKAAMKEADELLSSKANTSSTPGQN